MLGRHLTKYYKANHIKFKKITVEIEQDLYDKLINIKNDYFDRRSFKEIILVNITKKLEGS